jgi:putative salt-induced outer membrane protein YdiY
LSRSKFSSYEQEHIFTVGYGRVFLNTEKHKFNVEVFSGWRFAVSNDRQNAVSIDEFIVRTQLNYERIVTDNLQVKMDATLEAGHRNSVYSFNLTSLTYHFKQANTRRNRNI